MYNAMKTQQIRCLSQAAVEMEEVKPKKRRLRDPIALSDQAADRIKFLMSNRPDAKGVVLGVKRRGCNGLSYTLNYATMEQKFLDKVDSKGVTVFIEPKALMHLIGTTMDYYEDDVAAEFRFQNPNAEGHCGCGESFNSKVE